MNRLLELIAWRISKVRINRIHEQTIDGHTYIVKQRSRFSWPFIVIGNLVFRFRRVPVNILGRKTWIQWEQRLQQSLGKDVSYYGSNCDSNDHSAGLRIPKIPGRPLIDTLKGNTISSEEVLKILSLALAELHRLHQTEVEIAGVMVPLSHGDASVSNVIYDPQTCAISWFDFDLRHDFNRPALLRHADDLRAFVYTAAKSLPPEMFGKNGVHDLSEAIKDSYPSLDVWQAMTDITEGRGFLFDLFHRAQLWRL